MIRILIVDDQNLVQQGIKSLLDRDLDFKVIGTVKDGRNAVQQIAKIHPDIVLLDIEMPGMDGITTTKYINRVSPKTKVIILSSHEEKKYVTQALMAGAKGYLLKNSLMTDLKQAILAVNNGYSQIDSRLLAKVFDPQNIRAKKSSSSQESNIKTKSDLNNRNSQQPLSHQDNDRVKVKTDESENSINSIEDDNSALPSPIEKTETSKPAVLESDTAIQSKTLEVFQSETTALKPEQQSVSTGAYDSVVLKQTEQKKEVAQSNGYQKRSPYIASKTALATVEQKSLEKKHKSANFSPFLTQKALLIIARIKRLLNSLKSVSKLKINKSKGMQDLFWSIGLFILGILTVIILGKL